MKVPWVAWSALDLSSQVADLRPQAAPYQLGDPLRANP